MNPRDRHRSRIKASDLIVIDVEGNTVEGEGPRMPDPSPGCLHGRTSTDSRGGAQPRHSSGIGLQAPERHFEQLKENLRTEEPDFAA